MHECITHAVLNWEKNTHNRTQETLKRQNKQHGALHLPQLVSGTPKSLGLYLTTTGRKKITFKVKSEVRSLFNTIRAFKCDAALSNGVVFPAKVQRLHAANVGRSLSFVFIAIFLYLWSLCLSGCHRSQFVYFIFIYLIPFFFTSLLLLVLVSDCSTGLDRQPHQGILKALHWPQV